jgi:hypothetical protein
VDATVNALVVLPNLYSNTADVQQMFSAPTDNTRMAPHAWLKVGKTRLAHRLARQLCPVAGGLPCGRVFVRTFRSILRDLILPDETSGRGQYPKYIALESTAKRG